MLNKSLTDWIGLAIILLVSFPVHELAHAYAADYYGDDTPRNNGRLSLNPLAHLDIWGSLMLIVAGVGWAKPVPINEFELMRRNRWAPVYVVLAGPLSNLALALLAAIPVRLGLLSTNGFTGSVVVTFVAINLLLLFFNLIPLFPLDGEKVLVHLLPTDLRVRMLGLRRYVSFPLIIILFILPRLGVNLFGGLIFGPVGFLLNLLLG
jgi:Zn-dependent protease